MTKKREGMGQIMETKRWEINKIERGKGEGEVLAGAKMAVEGAKEEVKKIKVEETRGELERTTKSVREIKEEVIEFVVAVRNYVVGTLQGREQRLKAIEA